MAKEIVDYDAMVVELRAKAKEVNDLIRKARKAGMNVRLGSDQSFVRFNAIAREYKAD